MLVVNSDKNEKKMPQNKNDFFFNFTCSKTILKQLCIMLHMASFESREPGGERRRQRST